MKNHLLILGFLCFSVLLGKPEIHYKDALDAASLAIPIFEKNRNDSNFELKNGVLLYDANPYCGIANEYYPNESLKTKSEYFQGKRHGYYLGWYVNGQMWFERYYKHGIKTGVHMGWFQNEQQMFEYNFNDIGAYHGAVKDWYINGTLANWFNYKHGVEVGSQKMWSKEGKIKANFYTVKGERYGMVGSKNCDGVISISNE